MAFAICRIAKQQRKNLAAVQGHNMRTIEVKHADPDGQFERIVGDPKKTTEELIDAKIDNVRSHYKKKGINFSPIRKDAVLGVELMLTASPEYFRPTQPEKWGSYDQKRVDAWLKSTTDFLEKKFGKLRIAEITCHFDEATPHMHAMIMPLVIKTKNKRRTKEQIKNEVVAETYEAVTLDAKEYFNPEALVNLQTDYANAVNHLGLERGLRGSKARHKKSSKFYGLVNAPDLEKAYKIKYPIIKKPPVFDKEKWLGLTQKSVNSFIDKQLTKAIESNNKLKKLADSYKARYEALAEKSKGYWQRFGSPEKAIEQFQNNVTEIAALKNEVNLIDKDRERLMNASSEADTELVEENHKLKNDNYELTKLNEKLRLTNQSLTNQEGVKLGY
jgi:hypothetical protein